MLAAILAGGCVLPGTGISPYGKIATLYPMRGGSVSGELIASTSDSIWLLRNGAVTSYSSASIRKVNVERHRFDGKRTLVWMSVAGLATGAALTVACSNYDAQQDGGSSGCGGVLLGTSAFFAAVGGLFAISNDYSSMYHLVPQDTNRLLAYSRFPQGLPDSLRALRLMAPPSGAPRR